MTEYDIKRLGFILAIQAEIDGMKAANIYSMYTAEYIQYNNSDFQEKAEELRVIVSKHNQQL